MDYQKEILEALEFPIAGMQLNELHDYINRWRSYRELPNMDKSVLCRELKRLLAYGLVEKAVMIFPNDTIVEVYTDPLNLTYGFVIPKKEIKRLQVNRYKKAEKAIEKAIQEAKIE